MKNITAFRFSVNSTATINQWTQRYCIHNLSISKLMGLNKLNVLKLNDELISSLEYRLRHHNNLNFVHDISLLYSNHPSARSSLYEIKNNNIQNY